ncbi:MAG: hypothetical protein AUH25_03275 [Thaumarchaeota archaeon 13_1_40CM_38_12]|nr:MAG: hypothetical protein AUH25_03275 [Thaumarchaeota archaeon 13_1_40CM_38_12]OLD41375.1 MAG: hypothetical protein AUI60_01795 [Thaumarchaeota archaeon 13_1_40CM_2_39_4]
MNQIDNPNLKNLKTLLNFIGTPFNPRKNFELDDTNLNELFDLATKNRIGFLFLQTIVTAHMNDDLKSELDKQRIAYNNLRLTAQRAATILDINQCKYAIVKSNYDFPALPNDVDILVFGNDKEYKKTVECMLANQFEYVDSPEPLEVCLHDASRGPHFNDPSKDHSSKDPYDVDLYKEVGAGHIVYMHKNKLVENTMEITINESKVNVLKPLYEMGLASFHSIFPERIYTLLLHYHILFTIKQLSSSDMDKYLEICNQHKIRNASLLILQLVETIQEMCFGESPKQLTDLRERFGKKRFVAIDKMPYNYQMKLILNIISEKMADPVFRISACHQLISMLKPRYAKYMFKVYNDRQKRDTY